MSEPGSDERHLRALNPEQRRAVLCTDGPVLVLAGAGSGKTKTLVHRIVHLVRGRGVPPHRIVVVTFTNRAADEMRERVKSYAGDVAGSVVISTFHSLGVRLLRQHGERLGLPKRFAIYAQADQLGALRAACADISIDDDRFDMKQVLRRISDWKGRGVTPDEARRDVAGQGATGTRADDYAVLAADAYPRYQQVLRACGAVDFDDLLSLPVKLLESDEEVRRDVWRRYHHVMVDEYQDTNGIQLRMARLLAGTRRNLCVVGDDDQSIYAFRGADVGNILAFEEHFPGATVVTLEQNYRSTRRILEVANVVIAGLPHRHAKRLRTENPIGDTVDLYEHEDDTLEAETVASEISIRHFTRKVGWRDIGVLYRTNTQARPLEEALRAKGVPYRVLGGTSFFDRKEVADGVAYLRALAHPDDEIALRRIINYPTRGIGRTTVLRVAEHAQRRSASFSDALAAVTEGDVGAAQHAAIRDFLELVHDARAALREAERRATSLPPSKGKPPIAAWAEGLLRRLRLEEAIRADPRLAGFADRRVDNLRELVGALVRYERRWWAAAPEGATPSLSDALARLALSDLDDPEDDQETADVVTLMTLH
ncbi:MAG: ATP-dependent helicase, partial [Longimicrobiales bacterium]